MRNSSDLNIKHLFFQDNQYTWRKRMAYKNDQKRLSTFVKNCAFSLHPCPQFISTDHIQYILYVYNEEFSNLDQTGSETEC